MSFRLLVTGGAGFIGSNFIRQVLRERPEYTITNFDCLSYSGNLDNLAEIEDDPRYRFVHANICDPVAMQREVEACDAVVHFAAESHVDRSIENSRPFIETNVLGTQTLLDALRVCPGRRLVHVSTDEVYGDLPLDRPDLSFTEDMPLCPNSPYAASKAASDLLVRSYVKTFSVDALTTRCSNNFGPFQFPEKVIPRFVTRLLRGEKVPVYGDGRNVRDWLHVDDHGEAVLKVLEHGTSGEVYNIGGNNECSNLELTHSLLEILGMGPESIEFVQDRLGHDQRYAIDASKIRSELGWEPSRSAWPFALRETVEWYVSHQSWCERIRSGDYRRPTARYQA